MSMFRYWTGLPVRCDILPQELPTTLTTVLDSTFNINLLEIYNWTPGDVLVSVYDCQSPPIPLFLNEIVHNGVLTYKADVGRRMHKGLTWVCSVPLVYGYFNGYQITEIT